ncbi:MAG: hypothetical protein EAY77_03520, partial [Flavobacteriia bacterium]
MSIKAVAAKILARHSHKQTQKWANSPVVTQQKVFQSLLQQAKNTQFGKEHHFSKIKTFEDFAKQVPVRDYEQLKSYVAKVVAGESDILWKGKPLYFAKTSGTTSGVKYIPLTAASMPFHIQAAKNALL